LTPVNLSMTINSFLKSMAARGLQRLETKDKLATRV
jgi:hypothetical protein